MGFGMETISIHDVLAGLVPSYRRINAVRLLHGAFQGAEATKATVMAINAAYTDAWPTKTLREVIALDYHLEGFIILADLLVALRHDNILIDHSIVWNITFLVCAMQLCPKDIAQIKMNEHYELNWYAYSDVFDLTAFYLDKYQHQHLLRRADVACLNWAYGNYNDYFILRHRVLWKLIHMLCPRPDTFQYSRAMFTHEYNSTYHEILLMQEYYQQEQPKLWDTVMLYAQCMLPRVSLDGALEQLYTLLSAASSARQVYLLPCCLYVGVDLQACTHAELDVLLKTRLTLLLDGGYLQSFTFAAGSYDSWPITKRYLLERGLFVVPDKVLLMQIETVLASDNVRSRSNLPVLEIICCYCNYARLSSNSLSPSCLGQQSMFNKMRSGVKNVYKKVQNYSPRLSNPLNNKRN